MPRACRECLKRLYTEALADRELRQVVRPAYRNLMELLPGADAAISPAYAAGILNGSPLLAHDARGQYRFEQSDHVFYAERSGTRERLGLPEGLWTFVSRHPRGPSYPTTLLGGAASRIRSRGRRGRAIPHSTQKAPTRFAPASATSPRTFSIDCSPIVRTTVWSHKTAGGYARSPPRSSRSRS